MRSNVLRMITDPLDLAVRRYVIPGHQVVGIELKTYRPTAEEGAEQNAPWMFVTDEQVRAVAEGITVTRADKKGYATATRQNRRSGTGRRPGHFSATSVLFQNRAAG